MNIPLAALAGFEIELQVRVSSGGLPNVVKRTLRQGGSPQIRMQDHARAIDHRAQRIAESAAEFSFKRGLNSG